MSCKHSSVYERTYCNFFCSREISQYIIHTYLGLTHFLVILRVDDPYIRYCISIFDHEISIV